MRVCTIHIHTYTHIISYINQLLLQRAVKFGISYRNVSHFRPELVAVMTLRIFTHNLASTAEEYHAARIYKSTFEAGTEGWWRGGESRAHRWSFGVDQVMLHLRFHVIIREITKSSLRVFKCSDVSIVLYKTIWPMHLHNENETRADPLDEKRDGTHSWEADVCKWYFERVNDIHRQ